MSYLEEFKTQINNRDFHKFFQLWEEYCTSDQVDAKEFMHLLELIKYSDFAPLFGQFVETALPLWQSVQDEKKSHEILKLLMDLQTTNTPILAETALQALKNKYGNDPKFREQIRQIGLRTQESFQGAISNYELLNHLEKGNFVYHTGGWGTGEIMESSTIREQVAIEFENVTGIKHLSFDNAFKTLVPLQREHFLARRFADPDKLEADAKKDPVGVLKSLLRDLGEKTATEIKDELCVLVIHEPEWGKWWQSARAKLKKDTMVESPSSLKEPFRLRKTEISHEDQLKESLEEETGVNAILQIAYTFARDLPGVFRKEDVKNSLRTKLIEILSSEELTREQELQIILFLESMFDYQIEDRKVKDFIQSIDKIDKIINDIEIVAFKKKALVMVREFRSDWMDIFLSLLFHIQPNSLKDYLLKELNTEKTKEQLYTKLKSLLLSPEKAPEAYLWYFQRLIKKSGSIPFADKEGKCRFFEGFLILLHKLEQNLKMRDLTKKMYNLLVAKRFFVVRNLIEGTSLEFIKEFLLLISKCHVFSDHEKKIMRSLAQVVHPSLAPAKRKRDPEMDPDTLWTTEAGYRKAQEKLEKLAKDMVKNSKEVEEARAHGDLRENAEYKFACERRARIQGEMKSLSKQLNKARVITPLDILQDEVSIGSVVEIENSNEQRTTYTILGPWETDPEENIISYQSQLAKSMVGHKVGETFSFRDHDYTIRDIKSFLN